MESTATFDPATGVIGFSVKVAGRVIACHVTEDWLRDTYGRAALDDGALAAYAKRHAAIDAMALRAWLASRGVEPVWLKREQIWRQGLNASGEKRSAEKGAIEKGALEKRSTEKHAIT